MNTTPNPFGLTALPGIDSGTCPPDSIWQAIANATLPHETAVPNLRHAAQCRSCAELLAAATASCAAPEPESTEESAFLAQLATSTPAAQLTLAQNLTNLGAWVPAPIKPELHPTFTLPKPKRRFTLWTTLTAASLTLCAATVFLVRALRPPSDAQLLVLAYNKNRITELRLPGTAAVPLASPTRGPDTHQFDSIEYLKARTSAQEQFDRNPNDPRVRQFRGEVYIVHDEPEAARRDFEMAEALNPNLPRLKFDLATAYFELAESDPTNNALDYPRAIDLFMQYLQQVHNDDPTALFDLGLCWERNNVTSEAIKNFEAALALERDPAWRAEIQRHLAKLKALTALDLSPEQLEATLTPQHFLTLTTEAPGQYELYLDAATRKWLPNRTPIPPTETATPPTPTTEDPNLEPALEKLAQWGLTHHDRWLTDMLRQPQTPANQLATQTLAQAVTASAAGKADDALAASALAITQFRAAHNHPGQLRAQAEHMYALQRTLNSKQCDVEAIKALSDPNINDSSWLKAETLLEHSTCSFMRGNANLGLQTSRATAPFAFANQLDSIGLRASGFVVSGERRASLLREAWTVAILSLPKARTLYRSSSRQHQFLYDMSQIADSLGLKWTETGCSEAALIMANQMGNLQIEAQAAEQLALDESSIGMFPEAQEHLHTAEVSLRQLGDAKAARIFWDAWKIDQAIIESQRNGSFQALRTLQNNEQAFENLKVFESRESFYAEFARLLRLAGNPTESLEKANLAINSAEQRLSELKGETQRQAWKEQNEAVYQTAALDLLAVGKPAQALAVWNRLQTQPYATPYKTTIRENAFWGAGEPRAPASGRQRLTIAKLDETFVAWLRSGNPEAPLTTVVLKSPPTAIQQESNTLERLCADPLSHVADISLIGSLVDRDILSPLDKELDPSMPLELDLDRSLQYLPFAAIKHNGQFLGLVRPLIYLQRTGTKENVKNGETLTSHGPRVFLRQPNSKFGATIPETYDETSELLGVSTSASLQTGWLTRTGASVSFAGAHNLLSRLSSAELIHYTGHGIEDQAPTLSSAVESHDTNSLQSGILKQCRLAVMAACQTGAKREFQSGDVPALVRALLNAGAAHVLATQWDVDSKATHDIMVNFYRRLGSKEAFPDALQHAQQQFAASPETQHPFFWAPFQLIQAIPISAKGNY